MGMIKYLEVRTRGNKIEKIAIKSSMSFPGLRMCMYAKVFFSNDMTCVTNH